MNVLCIKRDYFNSISNLKDIKTCALLDRSIVDDKEDISLGFKFPQLIPSIIITCQGKILSYSRSGNETRLHGTKSILIGGHIDMEDVVNASLTGYDDEIYQRAILIAARRELKEEVGLDRFINANDFIKFLDIQTSDVSKVHIGIVFNIEIGEFSDVKPSEEIPSFEWVDPEVVKNNIEYEDWSSLVLI